MKKLYLVPCGWECTLRECDPGPFAYKTDEGYEMGFKSEYGTNDGKIEAYCSSGEFYCGPPTDLVIPLRIEMEEE